MAAERRLFNVQEFARRVGVTVRALHHYDRIGLLRPRRNRPAGYRLYGREELLRLEQIVVLKSLGLKLSEIREILQHPGSVALVLRRQRRLLSERRAQLDRALAAIAAAEAALQPGRLPGWEMLQKIVKEIAMQNESNWTEKYYSPEARAAIARRRAAWSPELQAEVSRQWAELFADIEAALGEDPAGAKAQALAARWSKLVAGFTGGNPAIQQGLNAMWADQQNWPAPASAYRIKPEIQEFILKAMRCGPAPR